MKSRILYPKNIWYNKEFSSLKALERLLCLYLVSNENIGLTRYYKQHDMEVCFLLGITQKQLDEAKQTISKTGLFYFCDEWVFINNDFSYCDYNGRDQLMEAKQKEYDSIPVDIIDFFQGVDKVLATGWQQLINNKQEIINNKYIKQKEKETSKEKENNFEEFWKKYPRKIGKQKAKLQYAKIQEQHEQVMEGLEKYLQYWQKKKTEMDFIPHPNTWLNQQRWQDEITIPVQKVADGRKLDLPENYVFEQPKKIDDGKMKQYRAKWDEVIAKKKLNSVLKT